MKKPYVSFTAIERLYLDCTKNKRSPFQIVFPFTCVDRSLHLPLRQISSVDQLIRLEFFSEKQKYNNQRAAEHCVQL